MRRREFIGIAGGAAMWPIAAEAAPARVAVLGVAPPADPTAERAWQVFADSLQALGWTEGKNITFIRRYSEGRAERAAPLAAELVAEKPDLIVTVTYPNTQAVQQTTKTIPIVFIQVPDPIGGGFVASLARPGGNITGTSGQAEDVIGKGLQLIKETRPGISRLAYLGYGEPSYWTRTQQIATASAEYLGLGLTMIPIKSPADFEPVFAQIRRERPDALVVSSIPLFVEHSKEIVAFAIDQRLPSFTFSVSNGKGRSPFCPKRGRRWDVSPCSSDRRQDPQGCEAGRYPGRAADEISFRGQPEDGARDRHRDPASDPRQRRRSD
jgi:putative ABC transport system substrate-binding protein